MQDCVLGDYTGIGGNCLISEGIIFKGHSMMRSNVHIYSRNHYYDKEEHCFNG